MGNPAVQISKRNWYDNNVLVNILLFILFPIGLYALWKSNSIAKWWKITGSVNIIFVASGLYVVINPLPEHALIPIESTILNYLITIGLISFIGYAINRLLSEYVFRRPKTE